MSLCELLGIEEPEIPEPEPEVKVTKLTPFDFTNAISYDKTNLFDTDDDVEKQYNSYIINRALSFSADMVLYANEMNRYPGIPKQMQFDFLCKIIRRKKRYDKWIKAEQEADDMAIIKEFYNYSNEKAKSAVNILMPDQIDVLKQRMNKGGMQTKTRAKKSKKDSHD